MTRLCDVLAVAGAPQMPAPGELRWADRAAIGRVREAVRVGLEGESLVVDCIELELEDLRTREVGGGLAPFVLGGGGRVGMAFGYWAPGAEAGAHEHNDWAVTAVVHNALVVETFDYRTARDERRLHRKNVFTAERGRVGNICEPCVHNPINRTRDWTVSLHVFGPNDRDILGHYDVEGLTRVGDGSETTTAGDDPVARWHAVRRRRQAVRLLATMLDAVGTERARAVRDGIDASLLALGERVEMRTELRRAVPAAFSVRVGERAELVLGRGEAEVVLLRLPPAAAPLLRFLVSSASFRAAELPGSFRDGDRLALARTLVEAGLFAPVAGGVPA